MQGIFMIYLRKVCLFGVYAVGARHLQNAGLPPQEPCYLYLLSNHCWSSSDA